MTKRLAGALASVLLHSALLALITKSVGPGESTKTIELPDSTEPLIAMVFLFEDKDASPAAKYRERLMPRFQPLNSITVPIPPLPAVEAIAADSFEQGRQIENLDDLKTVEHLQGIYSRQITERVARVLEMADDHATSSKAHCIVYVIQDEMGGVIDLDMNDCQRDPQELQRLAAAIRRASPLPLPPAGLAMGSYIKLDASSM